MTAAAKKTANIAIGDKAPDFSMPACGNQTVSLTSLKGNYVVLYFYPKDDTPGCTIEAKDFKEHMKEFEALGATIVGVSKDSLKSHDQFRQKYCLPFLLASDETGSVCDSYGVWVEKSMYGKKYMGIERATFLIDKNGLVRNVWRKVKVEGHVKEVLAAIRAMN